MSFQGFTVGAWRAHRRARAALALALALAPLACGAASASGVLAGPAWAQASPQAKAHKAPAARMTAAEAAAIKITSVSAVGDPSLGLVVTATFSGDVERYLGQGGLQKGLLALVLTPTAGQSPSGVVYQAGGFTTSSIPVRARKRKRVIVKHFTADFFAAQRVQRLPSPGQENVFVSGNQAIFYLPAIGLDQPLSIKVKAFSKNPVASKQKTTAVQPLTSSGWIKVLETGPTHLGSTSVTPTPLTFTQLDAVRTELVDVLELGFERELRNERQAQSDLKSSIGHYSQIASLIHMSRTTLSSELKLSTASITRLKTRVSGIEKAIQRIDGLLGQTSNPPVSVVQTDSGFSQAMTPQTGLVESTVRPQGVPVVDVDDNVRYQQFSGVGAAMPDSSAWLIYDNLPAAQRQGLMQALFGAPGLTNALAAPDIHLNFLRVPIAAGGAMTVSAPYSYDDNPPGGSDPSLADFSIAHDEPYILPTLQQALQINPSLKVLATPWSPPAWMKSNDSLDNAGAQGTLLPADYGPYANYIVKFIQAYQSAGIPIDAITPQNEPSSGTVATGYPGMTLPEPNEAQLIAQYLEPALRTAGLGTKIYGNDLSWDSSAYADSLAADPAAGPDLSGISWHCYFGSPAVMSQLHQTAPGLDQLVSECSPEIRAFGAPEFLISALRNWATAVSVWALALDPNGGPIQPQNDCGGCRGLVTINDQTQTLSLRPEYYQLGQVSAFVQPGATRIDSTSYVTYGVNSSNVETASSGLDDVAFLNPDGSKVLVAYNNSTAAISFAVDSDGDYYTYTIPAHAMTTFTWH